MHAALKSQCSLESILTAHQHASPDNVSMEGSFGLLKSEFFRSRDWEGWA